MQFKYVNSKGKEYALFKNTKGLYFFSGRPPKAGSPVDESEIAGKKHVIVENPKTKLPCIKIIKEGV